MKLFKKVGSLTVKKCFVAAQFISKYKLGKTRYLPKLQREEFLKRLEASKKYVAKMSRNRLDRFIGHAYAKRLRVYDSVDWYEGYVTPEEVGVWKKAGGLPLEWTKGSLLETARLVKEGLKNNDKKVAARSKRTIPRTMDLLDLIGKEKYLYPIIVPGGSMGRQGLKKMKGDIDDGNMRAIALIISGVIKFKAFVGVSKNR